MEKKYNENIINEFLKFIKIIGKSSIEKNKKKSKRSLLDFK